MKQVKARYVTYFSLACMIAGIAIATWSGYAYWQGYRAAQPLNKQSALHVSASRKEKAVRPKNGERIGALFIPKLNLSLPIYEGVDEAELRKGVGHYPKSALPGKNGNVVLSGHRDTVFRRLKGVGVHDQLIVRTARGEFVYRIKKVRIVGEDDRTVLVEKPRPTLTVTTCYPFDFIGNAKQRYVLIAELVRPRQRI